MAMVPAQKNWWKIAGLQQTYQQTANIYLQLLQRRGNRESVKSQLVTGRAQC